MCLCSNKLIIARLDPIWSLYHFSSSKLERKVVLSDSVCLASTCIVPVVLFDEDGQLTSSSFERWIPTSMPGLAWPHSPMCPVKPRRREEWMCAMWSHLTWKLLLPLLRTQIQCKFNLIEGLLRVIKLTQTGTCCCQSNLSCGRPSDTSQFPQWKLWKVSIKCPPPDGPLIDWLCSLVAGDQVTLTSRKHVASLPPLDPQKR